MQDLGRKEGAWEVEGGCCCSGTLDVWKEPRIKERQNAYPSRSWFEAECYD